MAFYVVKEMGKKVKKLLDMCELLDAKYKSRVDTKQKM